MRNWGATATWASLRASAFVDYDGASEQGFDAGGLAIVRGGTPLLVNRFGFIDSAFPGTQTDENDLLNELFSGGNPRRIYNTFYNGTTGQIPVEVDNSPAPGTRVARFEDGGSWVTLAADHLADVYPSADGVSAWTRELVYLRPGQFVVYDRTTVSTVSAWRRVYRAKEAQRRTEQRRVDKGAASRKIRGQLQELVETKLRLGWSPSRSAAGCDVNSAYD